MEIKKIHHCQEVLEFATAIKTEEERQCHQLFKDPSTIKLLKEKSNSLSDKISEINSKFSELDRVLNQRQEKEKDKEEINIVITKKTNELKTIEVLESDKNLNEQLKRNISDSERKIKEYNSDIYDIEQKKYKIEEQVKNEESYIRYLNEELNQAQRKESSAYAEFISSKQKESANSCWGGSSPELIHRCVENYERALNQKAKQTKEYIMLVTGKGENLKVTKAESAKLSNNIESLYAKKNEEISKRDQYQKRQKALETKIQKILNQQQSLETDIANQNEKQIKINEELVNLQEHIENSDSELYQEQKITFEKEFQMIDSLEQKVTAYQDFTNKYFQQQEL